MKMWDEEGRSSHRGTRRVVEGPSLERDDSHGWRSGRQSDSQWSRQSQVNLVVQGIIIAGISDAVEASPAKPHPAGASLRKQRETQRGKVRPEAHVRG